MIIVATTNQGKLAEIRSLSPRELEIRGLDSVDVSPDAETGSTFLENARIKAWSVAKHGYAVIADDSGLEVDALDGRPGVWSSRFSGPDATDEENNAKLLRCLADVDTSRRTARFRSVIVLAVPNHEEIIAEGTVEGVITDAPRGTNGFGYDPLFEIKDPIANRFKGRTMAELTQAEKNEISHRAMAYRVLLERARADIDLWRLITDRCHACRRSGGAL